MKFVFAIAENDQAMNLIFGNLRNLVVCAALFGAAGWSLQDPGNGWGFAVHVGAALALFLSATVLTMINSFHGLLKIKGLPNSTALKVTLGGIYLSLTINALGFFVSQIHLH